jgi:hypothetical protein
MSAIVTVSREELDVQKTYDATAAWLRDCCRKGDVLGVKKAESRLRELDKELAKQGEA